MGPNLDEELEQGFNKARQRDFEEVRVKSK